jgi:hypothetical protein
MENPFIGLPDSSEAVFVFFLLTFYRPGEGGKDNIQCRIQSQKAMRLPSNRGFSRITAKLFTTIFSIIVSLVSINSVDRLLGFFFSRRNLGLPHPAPEASETKPHLHLVRGGGTHSLRERGSQFGRGERQLLDVMDSTVSKLVAS